MKTIFRDALFIDNKNCLSGSEETALLIASRLSKDKLIKLMEVCDNIKMLAERNGNNAILITKLCYDLRQAQGR